MKFYSTSKQSPQVDFKEATILGLAPDKGLYFPTAIPVLDAGFLQNISDYTNAEIAFQVIKPFVGDAIPADILRNIVAETIDFEIPLVKLSENVFSLELFHGPTLAFKDIGARFMSRCLGYFARDRKEKIIVLVATSGDTGSAVANGFYNVEGIEVVILYPSGKVSNVQEKQLTTLGGNIHALEISGNFDDCQGMVKDVFADAGFCRSLFITSANSINVARWLPQQFYYFFAWKQWPHKSDPPVISVPSGNFGNICAGLLAQRSGLPAKHFIAACNVNDAVPDYLASAQFHPKETVPTISNAMDVGNPSNFIRIQELFGHDINLLRDALTAYSINDEQTKATIRDTYGNGYLPDPHGAVALTALRQFQEKYNVPGIFLETAHPVKFYDVVEPVIKNQIQVPATITAQLRQEKKSTKMNVDTSLLKDFLLSLR